MIWVLLEGITRPSPRVTSSSTAKSAQNAMTTTNTNVMIVRI